MNPVIPEQQLVNAVMRVIQFNKGDFAVSRAGSRNINVSLLNSRRGSSSLSSCPFQSTVTGDTFSITRPGYLNPVGMPINLFDGSALYSAVIPSEVSFLVGKVSTNGIVPTSWEIELRSDPAEPTEATPETAPSYFEFDMYVVMGNGTAIKRVIECGNLSAQVVEVLSTSNPDPTCGVNPLIKHYTWEVVTAD